MGRITLAIIKSGIDGDVAGAKVYNAEDHQCLLKVEVNWKRIACTPEHEPDYIEADRARECCVELARLFCQGHRWDHEVERECQGTRTRHAR
jgi:hypothetical protein